MMEFAAFKNPLKTDELRALAIEWAMRDVDKNEDGRISLDEYMTDFMTQPTANLEHYNEDFMEEEKHRFNDDFDRNGNGFLEGDELLFWMGPDNTEIALEEAGNVFEATFWVHLRPLGVHFRPFGVHFRPLNILLFRPHY